MRTARKHCLNACKDCPIDCKQVTTVIEPEKFSAPCPPQKASVRLSSKMVLKNR